MQTHANSNSPCVAHSTGAPCSILGSWNSEIIGLRFDINKTQATANPIVDAANALQSAVRQEESIAHDLTVRLFNHNPPKRNTLMSTNWSTLGFALNHIGGPFSITATVPKEQILATFTGLSSVFFRNQITPRSTLFHSHFCFSFFCLSTCMCVAGICKTCGGVDTIFGTWSISHPAKDCGDLQTTIETRRDIFRREMLFVKKQHRLEQLGLMNNETKSTETTQPIHDGIFGADFANQVNNLMKVL